VVAGENGQMERDYASCGVRDWADIRDPATVGREAGERAVARLGARKIDTQRAHVVFERRLAASLIGPLIDAIRGSSIARGVSFMKGKAGEQVLPRGLSLIDDPLRVRGLASRAFDGEGRPVARTAIVEDGILSGWLHNNASARQLGERPNGFAGFGFGDPPGIGTSNLYLTPGGLSPEALLKEAGTGLLVTDMFGPSLNPNTGDYSVGVSGFWFEGGERAYPVNEVTVAGSLPDMLARIVPASDLVFEYGTNVPTLLIPDVSLAGR
jgi:PmbA protein